MMDTDTGEQRAAIAFILQGTVVGVSFIPGGEMTLRYADGHRVDVVPLGYGTLGVTLLPEFLAGRDTGDEDR